MSVARLPPIRASERTTRQRYKIILNGRGEKYYEGEEKWDSSYFAAKVLPGVFVFVPCRIKVNLEHILSYEVFRQTLVEGNTPPINFVFEFPYKVFRKLVLERYTIPIYVVLELSNEVFGQSLEFRNTIPIQNHKIVYQLKIVSVLQFSAQTWDGSQNTFSTFVIFKGVG